MSKFTTSRAPKLLRQTACSATDVNAILELMDGEDVGKIRRILEHHEDRIADFATSRFISFPEQTSVQDVLGEYRFVAATADVWVYIYVVDARRKLLGVLDLQDVLKADPGDSLADLMTTNFVTLHVDDTVKDAAKLFDRYGFQAIPIVDADNLMIGVITFRDVMDLKDRSI